jgi:hypothetical protein
MVGEFLNAIVSWKIFVISLLLFGFAPGAALRLIVLAYRRDDPRRREQLGELHRVPRWERPFWVLEQLEVALSEGIGERIRERIREKKEAPIRDLIARGSERGRGSVRGFVTNEEVIEVLVQLAISDAQTYDILQRFQDENIDIVEMVDELNAEEFASKARVWQVKGISAEYNVPSEAPAEDPGPPLPPQE